MNVFNYVLEPAKLGARIVARDSKRAVFRAGTRCGRSTRRCSYCVECYTVQVHVKTGCMPPHCSTSITNFQVGAARYEGCFRQFQPLCGIYLIFKNILCRQHFLLFSVAAYRMSEQDSLGSSYGETPDLEKRFAR